MCENERAWVIPCSLFVLKKLIGGIYLMNIIQSLLTPNKYSRPQTALKGVKAVVIHWVANPGSSAEGNRNFFNNRKSGTSGFGSAHYIVEGTKVIQCLPNSELAYHVGSNVYTASALRNLSSYPNNCTIGIEMTHPDWTGKPDATTYKTTVELAASLLKTYGLKSENLWTHHQVVGWKDCHRYYTNNPSAWVQFVSDVHKALTGKTVTIPTPKPSDKNDLELVEAYGLGDKGSKVKEIQSNLFKLGYKLPKYGADSHFGDETVSAVKAFQKANKLAVDGIAGKATLAKIKELLTKSKTPSSPTPSKPSSSKASGSLKSKVDGLRFYAKASWDDKDVVGTVNKGAGFPTVVEKVKVGTAYQYKVKNSKGATYYITASDKYVELSGTVKAPSPAKKATKPKQAAKSSSIKSVGKIKIIGVSNAAIIMDKPDRNSAKNLDTIALGKTIEISGSVKGSNNPKGYWEVIYKGKRAYISGQYGSKV